MSEISSSKPKQVFFEDVEVRSEVPQVVNRYSVMKDFQTTSWQLRTFSIPRGMDDQEI
jgi:hypothetical protein